MKVTYSTIVKFGIFVVLAMAFVAIGVSMSVVSAAGASPADEKPQGEISLDDAIQYTKRGELVFGVVNETELVVYVRPIGAKRKPTPFRVQGAVGELGSLLNVIEEKRIPLYSPGTWQDRPEKGQSIFNFVGAFVWVVLPAILLIMLAMVLKKLRRLEKHLAEGDSRGKTG